MSIKGPNNIKGKKFTYSPSSVPPKFKKETDNWGIQTKARPSPAISNVIQGDKEQEGESLQIYDDYHDDRGWNSLKIPNTYDMWYRKENSTHRRARIFLTETLSSLWYFIVVGIGFRVLGNSWSFGLLQGFAFTSMVGLFWNEDFGFANFFVAMALCLMRSMRSKEYWIFLLHLAGHLVGAFLAIAGIELATSELPGLQTFGTPTKSALISETNAGFSEFISSALVALVIFVSVDRWKERVKIYYEEEREKKDKIRHGRYYKTPEFLLPLGLAYTALSIGFYDLTGSSFNFLRWAIPRICMGHYDLNPRDAIYYLVAHFFGVTFAAVLAFLICFYYRKTTMDFVSKMQNDVRYHSMA